MESRPVVSKRKSFWQLRPANSSLEQENAAVVPQTGPAMPALTPSETVIKPEVHERSSKRQKFRQIFERMKWWSKRKRVLNTPHISQTDLNHNSSSDGGSKEYSSTLNPHTACTSVETTPSSDPSPQPSSSPRQSMALDGTGDHKPLRGVNFLVPSRRTSILRHRSFMHLHSKASSSKESKSTVLKHSVSSPSLIREKLSQHFQGTVVRRPSARKEPILSILAAPPVPLVSPQKVSERNMNPASSIPSHEMIPHTTPVGKPTLRTVEVTAAAKTYLESHFSQLLSCPSNRSLRRRNFENELANRAISEQERRVLRAKWLRKESDYLRTLRSRKINIGDFELVKVIGKGAFGVVKLVREKKQIEGDAQFLEETIPVASSVRRNSQTVPTNNPSKVYALKVMPKADMLAGGQEGHIRAERDFLVASSGSRWMVPLVAAFQDEENLYLVMEYLIGGDFLGLLIQKTILSEDMTRFYIAEMVCCIEEAHNLGYIHRDIKPDNFIFTAEGHLKLCDFGLAFSGHRIHSEDHLENQRHSLLKKIAMDCHRGDVDRQNSNEVPETVQGKNSKVVENEESPPTWVKGKRELARSTVGTNQYMAPEVIRGEPYDARCDWWSLGIILYECLYGFTPFYCANRLETRQKILGWQRTLNFPAEPKISGSAYLLITSLLCEKQQRLTCKTYSENDNVIDGAHLGGLRSSRSRAPSATYTSTLNEIGDNAGFRNGSIAPESNNHNIMPKTHVLKNDAMEIKTHSFFKGIDWENLLDMKPPFVPEQLKGEDDTKYFDYESLGSSTSNQSRSKTVVTEGQESGETSDYTNKKLNEDSDDREEKSNKENRNPFADENRISGGRGRKQEGEREDKNKGKNNQKGQEQKRVIAAAARDVLLRDPVHGTELMELRKQVAFLGYSYRRPRTHNISTTTGGVVDLFLEDRNDDVNGNSNLTGIGGSNRGLNQKREDVGRRRVTVGVTNWPPENRDKRGSGKRDVGPLAGEKRRLFSQPVGNTSEKGIANRNPNGREISLRLVSRGDSGDQGKFSGSTMTPERELDGS